MKITSLKTYIVPFALSETSWGPGVPWVLVRLETDNGIAGWGQAYTFHDREQAIALSVHNCFPVLDGMDPFHIRHFLTTVLDGLADADSNNEISAAVAAIEIALWDIVGKALDSPVHRMLGGPCRDRIGVYANCWSNVPRSPDELAAFAATQAEKGFKAVKIYPFLYGNTPQDGGACLTAVRDAVGPEVSVFVDMWYRMHEQDQAQIVELLHAHEVPWFEDPAAATEAEKLARIRAQSKLPVISGETLYRIEDFRRLLEHKAVDTLNPDISLCGIVGTTEIAAMAKAFGVNVSVHNNNTMTIGLGAAMQVAAVIPNLALVEYFPRFEQGSSSFSTYAAELDEDGCISLPQIPGIGVTVDEATVDTMEYKPVTSN